jgi:hypothetical protein
MDGPNWRDTVRGSAFLNRAKTYVAERLAELERGATRQARRRLEGPAPWGTDFADSSVPAEVIMQLDTARKEATAALAETPQNDARAREAMRAALRYLE